MEPASGSAMPNDGHRLFYEALQQVGWAADPKVLAEKIQRLDLGLPCEDEFAVICAWLGKCELLHKLDQKQVPPASRAQYQVPDLLARFSTQTTDKPVLIEVKSKAKKTLGLSPDYLAKLQRYADLLGLPLLIAWKFHSVWVLFEATHLKKAKKNFNISFLDASKENLLGPLVGDLAYSIGPHAGMRFAFRKEGSPATAADGVETWSTRLEEFYFTDREGCVRTDLSSEVKALIPTWDLEEKSEISDTHIRIHFTTGGESRSLFAHQALVRLLNWESGQGGRPHWRGLLDEWAVTKSINDFATASTQALDEKVLSRIFHIQPQTMPAFLQ